jgi:DNA-binding response OmpR family regulator
LLSSCWPDDDRAGAATRQFGIRELMARVAAIFRRGIHLAETGGGLTKGRRLQTRDLVLDPDRREALVRNEPVSLT